MQQAKPDEFDPGATPQGVTMDNEITCPNCQRKITRTPIIEDAAKGEGSDNQFLICECGERISYWQITAQLRKQKTLGTKIHTMFQGLFKGHG
jgi:hypothetical protein